jgi:hypothetical protein
MDDDELIAAWRQAGEAPLQGSLTAPKAGK